MTMAFKNFRHLSLIDKLLWLMLLIIVHHIYLHATLTSFKNKLKYNNTSLQKVETSQLISA